MDRVFLSAQKEVDAHRQLNKQVRRKSGKPQFYLRALMIVNEKQLYWDIQYLTSDQKVSTAESLGIRDLKYGF